MTRFGQRNFTRKHTLTNNKLHLNTTRHTLRIRFYNTVPGQRGTDIGKTNTRSRQSNLDRNVNQYITIRRRVRTDDRHNLIHNNPAVHITTDHHIRHRQVHNNNRQIINLRHVHRLTHRKQVVPQANLKLVRLGLHSNAVHVHNLFLVRDPDRRVDNTVNQRILRTNNNRDHDRLHTVDTHDNLRAVRQIFNDTVIRMIHSLMYTRLNTNRLLFFKHFRHSYYDDIRYHLNHINNANTRHRTNRGNNHDYSAHRGLLRLRRGLLFLSLFYLLRLQGQRSLELPRSTGLRLSKTANHHPHIPSPAERRNKTSTTNRADQHLHRVGCPVLADTTDEPGPPPCADRSQIITPPIVNETSATAGILIVIAKCILALSGIIVLLLSKTTRESSTIAIAG